MACLKPLPRNETGLPQHDASGVGGNWTAVFYFIASFGGVAGGRLAEQRQPWHFHGLPRNPACFPRAAEYVHRRIAVVPFYLAPHEPALWLTVLIVGLVGSAHQGWSANQFSFVSDTMPKHAVSSLVGVGGGIAYFTSVFMTEIIELIPTKSGRYASVFTTASCVHLASLLVIHLLSPRIGAARRERHDMSNVAASLTS